MLTTLLATLALIAPASADDVGLRVLVQPWTPWADDDNAYPVVDDPTLISGTLHDAWTANSDELHAKLGSILSQGDLIGDGVTLYDLDLRIPEPSLSASSPNGTGAGLEWTVRFDNVHLEATSTTPDVAMDIGFGDDFDPRCSLDFDLTVTVPVGIGDDPAAPFFTDITADQAADRPIASISDFRLDSQNLPCDVIVGVMQVVGLDAVLTDAVTRSSSPLVRPLNEQLIGLLAGGVSTANSTIGGLVPAGMVRIDSWVWAGQPITLAFGVQGPVPDYGPTASIGGTFTPTVPGNPLASKLACENIPVSVARKTGPRPIVNPLGHLGEEPLEELGAYIACGPGDENGVASYTLNGLSSGFPNLVRFGSSTGCDTSNPASLETIVDVEGIPGRLLPADLVGTYDLEGGVQIEPCGAYTAEVQTWYEEHVDPVINPADSVWSVLDDGAWTRFGAAFGSSTTIDAGSLSAPVIREIAILPY